MSRQINHFYEFGEFRLNTSERLLERCGKEVPLSPKVFDLLLVLVRNHGRIVDKDQLMTEVWPETFVEETNLKVYVSTLRKILGDGQSGHKYIETLPKRGYRFVTQIAELTDEEPDLIVERQS